MRLLLALSAAAGFSAVAFGAFGGHGLRKKLADVPDGAKRLEWWQTGASYHLAHALAIGLAALAGDAALTNAELASAASAAAWAFLAGIVLFSGSLYVMALTGARKLGAVTPLGGLALLAGWACLLAAALQG